MYRTLWFIQRPRTVGLLGNDTLRLVQSLLVGVPRDVEVLPRNRVLLRCLVHALLHLGCPKESGPIS